MSAKLLITDPVLLDFALEVGDSGPVAIAGNRTRWDLGGPAVEGTRLLTAPTGIVNYVPDEMTVTVRCGTSVEELHQALAEKGQRTGLPERGGTVGGALAVGENCLHVLGRGRVRETALQVRYVSDDGKVVTGGGPTVKNVTGFDLPRLMVGSLGTLGLLTEAILRTNPIPTCTRWLRSEGIDPFAVTRTVLRPSAVLWDGTSTWIELEDHPAAVDAEQARLAAVADVVEVDGPPPLPEHRWSLTPGALRDTSQFGAGSWIASVGVGTAWASQQQPAVVIERGVATLSARVKEQFDSRGRLNPGRTPGAR
jgi:glycolate oxidase FAD binding subunit